MVRAAGAGAGATAAAANGGAIAAAVAATGRGTAVGDRSRGCRRRSSWVRPGLRRAGGAAPPRLVPGLCVGPSGREPRRRPSLGRWVRGSSRAPGAGGARRRASRRAWPLCRTCPPGQKRAAAGRLPALFPAPGGRPRARRGQLQSCQRFPQPPLSVTDGEVISSAGQDLLFRRFLTVLTQTLLVIFILSG